MSFMRQQLVLSSGVGVFNYSGLSSVIFQNLLYVFFSGSGKDGVWYAILDQNTSHWSGPFSCLASGASGMGIAEYTSPCSVVFKGELYLFFNGAGKDGTYWTQSPNGRNWTPAASVSQNTGKRDETFGSYTSPSATVYRNDLYLFWNNSGSDGVRYTYLANGSPSFVRPMDVTAPGVGIRRQTSPAAVTFGDSIYLFYNGSGHESTWVATLNSGVWSAAIQSVGGNFLDYTSPGAYLSDDGRQMTVLWNGYADDGVFYTTTQDGKHWEQQISLRNTIGGMGMLTRSSPTGVNYGGIPYIFWAGMDGQIWLSQGLTFSIDGHPDLSPILQALQAGDDFVLTSYDTETVQYFLENFHHGANPLPGPNPGAGLLKGRQRILQVENWAHIVNAFFGKGKLIVGGLVVLTFSMMALAIRHGYRVTLDIGINGLRLSLTPTQSHTEKDNVV